MDDARPTTVYQFFNADDELIYVGITYDFKARLSVHKWRKAWWPEVARIETRDYPTRFDAQVVEHHLMRAHLPKHNRCYYAEDERERRGVELASPFRRFQQQGGNAREWQSEYGRNGYRES